MGQSSGSNQTTTTQQLTPEQQALTSLAAGQFQQFAGSNPTLPTGNQAVAPFTPAQQQGQQMTLGAAGQMEPVLGSAAGTNQYLSSGAFLDPGSNPYVQNAVKAATDPIFQDLSQRTLPGQQATAGAGSGVNYGGSREGVQEGLDVQGAQRAAGQAGANIMNTALGQGLTATNQAIQQAPTTAGSLALPGGVTSAVGDVQQQQAQNVLNANNQASWFQQMLPLLKAQMLTGGAAGLPGGSSVSTGTTQQNADPISQIIGGVSAAGGLAGGLGKLLPFFSPSSGPASPGLSLTGTGGIY
jgi:hypothetical protein